MKEEGAESADAEKEGESTEVVVRSQEGEDQQDQTVSNAGPGFNAMNGAFPNMNFGAATGNMDQMQMMMAMQNGMPAGAFSGFPMMGTFYPPATLPRVSVTCDGAASLTAVM